MKRDQASYVPIAGVFGMTIIRPDNVTYVISFHNRDLFKALFNEEVVA